MSPQEPLKAEDFYFNAQGLMVFTAQYHLKRGYCCKNACKHCPYGFKERKNPMRIKKLFEFMKIFPIFAD